ncbi:4a-hydroxytetrahydrobiopterin dehydratase [Peribacillus glennii]|uniref:4a-hydroxytetrahydrobiopterin dehydratase n=1 Tax=Peribacillus glennii TaxID=2303991 RepID=A0A372LGF6_9BACI|nr:4a-hydroxytetrahydrobiopterin dehydratase [Peribacillus glennii]RFU65159.1 4a-hydroxytetrahydrobiopterin dehydratase [Peribacillus glennii]
MATLPVETIVTHISKFPGWKHVGNTSVTKNFSFSSFEKMGHFVYLVTQYTEKEEHYPQISITNFDVSISLSTASASGVTGKDLLVAQRINQIEYTVKSL